MTRQKKSRKPGVLGTKSTPKNLREHVRNEAGKKPSKAKGKPAGNRHSLVDDGKARTGRQSVMDDPRLGSKRKIPLEVSPTPTKPANDVGDAGTMSPEQEFTALENNPRLQQLLAQLDDGQTLSADDQRWVDRKLARYQTLAQQLGIELDEGADESDSDDDDLEPWQRFENPKDWVE